jgi:hypothetical protein
VPPRQTLLFLEPPTLPRAWWPLALVIPVTIAVRPKSLSDSPPPALVILITVDQMRPDYFTRFGDWHGGFALLMSHGAVYLHGRQDHAMTETAPGHATLLSGRHPSHTGIPTNGLGVEDSTSPVLGGGAPGASPRRFVGSTLIDWLGRGGPLPRFLSVAQKDRAAILPAGRGRGAVYWYVDGRFTTSRYYADSLPAWLTEWNTRRGPARLAGRVWTLEAPHAAYAEPDSAPWENGGVDIGFPHSLPTDTLKAEHQLPGTPWIDSLTLDLALDGTRSLRLGRGVGPELLLVGLSGTDHIGHAFGPDSREIHDQMLRLDRWIGWFLDSLAVLVPRERTLVVFTADHGVTSFPEFLALHDRPGGRIPLGRLAHTVNLELGRLTGDSGLLSTEAGLILADTARLRALRIRPESLATALAPRVWHLAGVTQAWTPATLGSAVPLDVHAARWSRSLPATLPWLVCAVAGPGYQWADNPGSTGHGTTNEDDVGVPIILLGPWFRPGVHPDSVRTVDIAPTLARVLGVKPTERLDGRPIRSALP